MARWTGLDIGRANVRALAVERTGTTWRVVRHGAVSRSDSLGQERPLAAALSELAQLVPLSGAVVASSELNVMARYVHSIPMPADRVARLLRLELSQHADASGELAADAHLVPIGGDELIHACALAPPAEVLRLDGELHAMGIRPSLLHVGAAALYNATLPAPPVTGDQLALIVDLDAHVARVALVGEGRLLGFRQLGVGAAAFREAQERQRSAPPPASTWRSPVTRPAGDSPLKLDDDSGAVPVTGAAAPSTAELRLDDDSGVLPILPDETIASPLAAPADLAVPSASAAPAAVPAALAPLFELGVSASGSTLASAAGDLPAAPGRATVMMAQQMLGAEQSRIAEQFFAQLTSTLAWFRAQLKLAKLDLAKVLLTGEGAAVAGLAAYLQRRFGVTVERFDPCAGLAGAPADGTVWAVPLALALSRAPGGVRLDLSPDRVVRRRLWRSQLVWPFVAAAMLAIGFAAIGWGWWTQIDANHASLERYKEYDDRYSGYHQQLVELERERDDLSEDLRAIASRLYANRDLLYTVRALKEQAPENQELWITHLRTVGLSSEDPLPGVKPGASAPPAPAASTSRRVTTADAKPKRQDSAIQRGAVDVAGKVKFATTREFKEMNEFFEKYLKAVEKWPTPGASRLFYGSRVLQHISAEDPKRLVERPKTLRGRPQPAKALVKEEGRFEFEVRLFFTPTELNEITVKSAAASGAVAPAPPPPAPPAGDR